MKKQLLSLLLSGFFLFACGAAQAATARAKATPDSPTEVQRKAAVRAQKAAAREQATATKQVSKMKKLSVKSHRLGNKLEHLMLVVLGMEESKTVTSPRQLKRQLHSHQKQMKMRAKLSARARRSHTHD
ncbi:hypothetical protein MUN81_06205 [Hymenobacter sp. 5317J-9]|uniref:hypothetical protein n=1 Tax=Hymenobacter sp. 5317J-9 TaxID=2932250 RepID=UPI001FD70949|nr:hypothetical protein [Hymenobacter sp. 5317J-9]UOQ99080.1 hypothetical protein MUN81_06205 [Hymenobacter sp. 5317J-9]